MNKRKKQEEKLKKAKVWHVAKSKQETTVFEMLSNITFSLKYIYKANKLLYLVRFLLILIQTLTTLIPIIFVRQILNSITIENSIKKAMIYTLAMAIIAVIVSILNTFVGNIDRVQHEKTMYNIKRQLGQAIMELPYCDLESPKMRDFVSLAQYSRLDEILMYFTGFFGAVINAVSLAAIILTISPYILILLGIVIAFKIFIDKVRRKLYYKYRGEDAPIKRKLQYFSNIMTSSEYGKEVRANSLEDWLAEKYKKTMQFEYIPLFKFNQKSQIKLDQLINLSGLFQKGAIYLLLAYKVVFEGLLIGDFSMYLSSVNSFADSIAGISGCFSNLMTCGLFAKEFRFCVEESTKIKKDTVTKKIETQNTFSIDFVNVSFNYPNTDNMVLDNINLKLKAGESLSIVGMNGAGKTTFVKLLCRLYKPTSGKILLNGISIYDYPLEEYNSIIGVVFQDFKLFAFSVKENIQMNSEDNEEKIYKAIDSSGLTQKIESLPKEMNTYVYKEFDSEGVEFSGGEGQKLAIARTIYKDTPIVILDEPTSALDPIAEYDVFERFNTLSKGKTSIFISHRLSSTKFTDKIAVFEQGKIVEFGNHKELISKENGLYKKMFEVQSYYYST